MKRNDFTFLRSKKARPMFKYSNIGFTLAEVLIVIAIVAIIGVILVTIFTNTLRGSNKAQVLSNIKQTGQAILDNMSQTIRGAAYLVCPTITIPVSPPNTLVVQQQDGSYTRYRIVLATDNTALSPSGCSGSDKTNNGCIIWDNPVKQTHEDGTPESDTEFIQRVCNSVNPMTLANILTDTNTQTGIKVKDGSFSSSQSAGYSSVISINFRLQPGAQAPAVTAGQIDPVTFQTTIELRNK